ncbi:hypothetical protein D9758_009453 [Tetrapyrgos nigripes]|uniref:Uncharacterized protein n=1 Tax=Tetrapyrgos nigripes TaxID=182062 RepID=A0A8H5D3J1_9AGAR|nr:hypothetical protein D9758_009453 [Tetrapyrgos nigripes]
MADNQSSPTEPTDKPSHASQPVAKPPMSTHPSDDTAVEEEGKESFLHTVGSKYKDNLVDKGTEKAADMTVEYVSEDPQQKLQEAKDSAQQKLDDARDEARGLWTKYCGCFGSA